MFALRLCLFSIFFQLALSEYLSVLPGSIVGLCVDSNNYPDELNVDGASVRLRVLDHTPFKQCYCLGLGE